jgi:hypothetical protein
MTSNNYKNYGESAIFRAIDFVCHEGYTTRKASEETKVPHTALSYLVIYNKINISNKIQCAYIYLIMRLWLK